MSDGRGDLPPSWHAEERERRVDHMIQTGRIVKVDAQKSRATVMLNGGETKEIPWALARAGKTKKWYAPDEGEMVIVFSPSGSTESAFIWGSIPNDDNKEAGDDAKDDVTEYEDGSKITYDKKNKKYDINLNKDASAVTTIGDFTMTKTKDGAVLKVGDVSIGLHKDNGVSFAFGDQKVNLSKLGLKIDSDTEMSKATNIAKLAARGTVLPGVG